MVIKFQLAAGQVFGSTFCSAVVLVVIDNSVAIVNRVDSRRVSYENRSATLKSKAVDDLHSNRVLFLLY